MTRKPDPAAAPFCGKFVLSITLSQDVPSPVEWLRFTADWIEHQGIPTGENIEVVDYKGQKTLMVNPDLETGIIHDAKGNRVAEWKFE